MSQKRHRLKSVTHGNLTELSAHGKNAFEGSERHSFVVRLRDEKFKGQILVL
jgi:hypothetical protein